MSQTSRESDRPTSSFERAAGRLEEEIAALREAFRRAMEITDSRGYLHFGSLHGQGDPPQCEHRNQLFLPWHRAYLYVFELALQDLVPGGDTALVGLGPVA